MNGDAFLATGATRVNRLRLMAWTVAVLSAGVASAVVCRRIGLSPWLGLVDAALIAATAAWVIRSRPVTEHTVAAHLDRVMPELEESATLLLGHNEAVLARLQRARVRAALTAAQPEPLPVPGARTALLIATLAMVVGTAAVALPATRASDTIASPAGLTRADAPLAIERVRVRWAPPAYTRRASRVSPTLNVTVEEGSTVTWDVAAPTATMVHLVTSGRDTLAMTRAGAGGWTTSMPVARPVLWHVVASRDTARARSDDHLVSVSIDHPPLLSVITPPSRLSIAWPEPHLVDARALVSDDHGLGAMRLVATVASGRGEGVRFREKVLDVELEERRGPLSVVVMRRVNLDSLGVIPGDEVLLAFEAADRRAPVPQVARSETIFITVLDTVDAPTGELPGISLRVEPAYFRSQRQIIIDTESLLRDMRQGRGGDTLRRSMDIGYDQHLLRLRYGQLVGEETEGMGAEEEHAHESDAPVTEEDFRHNHDMEENATLLGASVKTLLKRALSAMWEAEKHLRTGNARAALPWEYRSLEALEEIRRASRAYVKRIGFEPPSIDVAKTRLTKTATGLASLARTAGVGGADLDAPVRDALLMLETPPSAPRNASLEAAGVRLGERALQGEATRHLETLALLRRLLDGCADCAAAVRRGLLAALPVPPAPLRARGW